MLFSSIIFLFYFLPTVLLLYYIFYKVTPVKNFILLLASLFFYAWGEPWFVMIMVLSIIINYALAIGVSRVSAKKSARFFLAVAVVFNIGLLFMYRYLDFILINLGRELNVALPLTNLKLPLGISFFTFQALSYVIDVYRDNGKVQKNIFDVALYISFFPQLIAGPIVKYSTVKDQIRQRKETMDKFAVGICRFIAGLGKKVMIANNLSVVADRIFESNAVAGGVPTTLAWLGAVAYTLEIFFDFCGYSDMAIGLGLMFGFKFEENFNYPYIARSVSEFWRRWHISLGNWFKEYVYFPLGGSRVKNQDRVIKNLLIVWLVTGIWHGAEWSFVIWGLYNFAFLVIERFVDLENIPKHNVLKWCYTMLVITIGWVIFRAGNLVNAGSYLASMFGARNGFLGEYTLMYLKEYGIFFILGILFCIPMGKRYNYMVVNTRMKTAVWDFIYPIAMIGIFLISVTYIINTANTPFLYFNF